MPKSKKVTYITPIGEFCWPKLDTPDTFTPKKGKGAPKVRYTLNMRFDAKTEAKVRGDLERLSEGLDVGDNENSPWKEDKKDGKGVGTYTLGATSGANLEDPKKDFKPPVFDAKNKRLPEGVAVGGGSRGRMEVTLNGYDGFGGGVNLYINGVQVVELVERSFGKSNFDEVEDGYDASETTASEGFGSSNDDNNDDDEIPF